MAVLLPKTFCLKKKFLCSVFLLYVPKAQHKPIAKSRKARLALKKWSKYKQTFPLSTSARHKKVQEIKELMLDLSTNWFSYAESQSDGHTLRPLSKLW